MYQKRKRRDGFLFTSVSFYRFLSSFIFPFVLFFFKCRSKVFFTYIYIYIYIYIYMYVYSADYLHDAPLAKMNHQHILEL